MSDHTREALDKAIREHFEDEGIISAWAVTVEVQGFDADTGAVYYCNDLASSESSPNTLASLSAWASAQFMENTWSWTDSE